MKKDMIYKNMIRGTIGAAIAMNASAATPTFDVQGESGQNSPWYLAPFDLTLKVVNTGRTGTQMIANYISAHPKTSALIALGALGALGAAAFYTFGLPAILAPTLQSIQTENLQKIIGYLQTNNITTKEGLYDFFRRSHVSINYGSPMPGENLGDDLIYGTLNKIEGVIGNQRQMHDFVSTNWQHVEKIVNYFMTKGQALPDVWRMGLTSPNLSTSQTFDLIKSYWDANTPRLADLLSSTTPYVSGFFNQASVLVAKHTQSLVTAAFKAMGH